MSWPTPRNSDPAFVLEIEKDDGAELGEILEGISEYPKFLSISAFEGSPL